MFWRAQPSAARPKVDENMRSTTHTGVERAGSSLDIGSHAEAGTKLGGDGIAHGVGEPVVTATALKSAIAQLRELTKATAGRSSQEALAANLMLLRNHGVDDEILNLVVEMAMAQDVDEEMTAAINYLASGFLLALLSLGEEVASGPRLARIGMARRATRS